MMPDRDYNFTDLPGYRSNPANGVPTLGGSRGPGRSGWRGISTYLVAVGAVALGAALWGAWGW